MRQIQINGRPSVPILSLPSFFYLVIIGFHINYRSIAVSLSFQIHFRSYSVYSVDYFQTRFQQNKEKNGIIQYS